MREQPKNIQSGEPTAESTFDAAEVARADDPESTHFEADPDQIVKVVHQDHPDALPVDSPTDYARQGGLEDTSVIDVRVTRSDASVHEATPPPDAGEPE